MSEMIVLGESFLNRDGPAPSDPRSSAVGGGAASAASRIYRRKMQKKLMQIQPHYGISWPSGGVLAGASKAANKFQVHTATTSSASGLHPTSKQKTSTDSSPAAETARAGGSLNRAARRLDAVEDDVDMLDDSARLDNGSLWASSATCPSPSSGQPPLFSSKVAQQVAKNLISFLIVIGNQQCAAHEETFLLTCKVLARLMAASRYRLRLGHITDQQQLTTLLRLAVDCKSNCNNCFIYTAKSFITV